MTTWLQRAALHAIERAHGRRRPSVSRWRYRFWTAMSSALTPWMRRSGVDGVGYNLWVLTMSWAADAEELS